MPDLLTCLTLMLILVLSRYSWIELQNETLWHSCHRRIQTFAIPLSLLCCSIAAVENGVCDRKCCSSSGASKTENTRGTA
uniref:Putative secreted protein n=1 Tax=Anopheles marajoara TaxID=58244 RepID=A0A2M4CBP8_9DIPT